MSKAYEFQYEWVHGFPMPLPLPHDHDFSPAVRATTTCSACGLIVVLNEHGLSSLDDILAPCPARKAA